MRPVQIVGHPPDPETDPVGTMRWIIDVLSEIANASIEEVNVDSAGSFEVSNLQKVRAIDPNNITLQELANAFATFIQDNAQRGVTRTTRE